MARLPKVKLRHRRTGARVNVDALAYACDLGAWADWERAGETRGDATSSEQHRHARELAGETVRAAQPERSTAPARYRQRAITVTTGEPPPDWRTMKWFAARAYVGKVTGVLPDNKAKAERLMAGR